MNWLVLLIAFSLAVLMGAWLVRVLSRSKPQWTDRRRMLVAASILPAFALFVSLIGIAWVLIVGPGTGENMLDLAVVVTGAMGGIFALLTFVGGLVGASLARRRP